MRVNRVGFPPKHQDAFSKTTATSEDPSNSGVCARKVLKIPRGTIGFTVNGRKFQKHRGIVSFRAQSMLVSVFRERDSVSVRCNWTELTIARTFLSQKLQLCLINCRIMNTHSGNSALTQQNTTNHQFLWHSKTPPITHSPYNINWGVNSPVTSSFSVALTLHLLIPAKFSDFKRSIDFTFLFGILSGCSQFILIEDYLLGSYTKL